MLAPQLLIENAKLRRKPDKKRHMPECCVAALGKRGTD
jgi:hypothetical protein